MLLVLIMVKYKYRWYKVRVGSGFNMGKEGIGVLIVMYYKVARK